MSKPILSASDFLAAIQRKTEVFEIDGVGAVRIQALSVSEAVTVADKYGQNMVDGMFEIVALGLVEPALDEAQVELLRDAMPGPMMALFERISNLSALTTSAEATERTENLAGGGSSG